MTIAELKEKNITELTRIARTLDLPGASGLRKQDLIFKILQAQSEKEGHIFAEGVLEISQKTRATASHPRLRPTEKRTPEGCEEWSPEGRERQRASPGCNGSLLAPLRGAFLFHGVFRWFARIARLTTG